jgi:glycosyltransferase involved in cell wall biosynthesis
MTASPIPISIIIPVYNGGLKFRECLESVSHLSPPPFEIIVVGDGDTDGSHEMARHYGCTVISRSVSEGPATARNIGARTARGEILLFLDADVAVKPDILAVITSTFAANPSLSAIIGSYDDAPDEKNFLSQYKNLFHHYTHQAASENATTFWGACGAIRRDVFWEISGFDERYRYPSVEDIELGYRLYGAGYSIYLLKTLQVKHLKRWNIGSLLKAEFFYRALPWMELILCDRQLRNDLNLRWESRVSILLVYGLLFALIGLFWHLSILLLATLILLVLVILNRSIYGFFIRVRGVPFTLQVLPWHLMYYGYCGLAVVMGTLRFWLKNNVLREPKLHFPGCLSEKFKA